MKLTINHLEGDFSEVIQGITASNDLIILDESLGCQTRIEPTYIYIPTLNLDIHTGYYYIFDFQSKEYNLDTDLYIFFNHETKKEMYFECGSILSVCIYNYLHFIGVNEKTLEEIENLECIYVIDIGSGKRKVKVKARKLSKAEEQTILDNSIFEVNPMFDDLELLGR